MELWPSDPLKLPSHRGFAVPPAPMLSRVGGPAQANRTICQRLACGWFALVPKRRCRNCGQPVVHNKHPKHLKVWVLLCGVWKIEQVMCSSCPTVHSEAVPLRRRRFLREMPVDEIVLSQHPKPNHGNMVETCRNYSETYRNCPASFNYSICTPDSVEDWIIQEPAAKRRKSEVTLAWGRKRHVWYGRYGFQKNHKRRGKNMKQQQPYCNE